MTFLPLLLLSVQMHAAPIQITHGHMQFTTFGSYIGAALELYGDGLEIKGSALYASPLDDGCYISDARGCPDGTLTSPTFYGVMDAFLRDSVLVEGVRYYRSPTEPTLYGFMHFLAGAGAAPVAEVMEVPFSISGWKLWIQDSSKSSNPRDVNMQLDLQGSGLATATYRRIVTPSFPEGYYWNWTGVTYNFVAAASDVSQPTAAPEPGTAAAGALALALGLCAARRAKAC